MHSDIGPRLHWRWLQSSILWMVTSRTQFPNIVVWADDATVKLNGCMNLNNCSWAPQNAKVTLKRCCVVWVIIWIGSYWIFSWKHSHLNCFSNPTTWLYHVAHSNAFFGNDCNVFSWRKSVRQMDRTKRMFQRSSILTSLTFNGLFLWGYIKGRQGVYSSNQQSSSTWGQRLKTNASQCQTKSIHDISGASIRMVVTWNICFNFRADSKNDT